MMPNHPQGQALAKGTLRKDKTNKGQSKAKSRYDKPLPPAPVALHPSDVRNWTATSVAGLTVHDTALSKERINDVTHSSVANSTYTQTESSSTLDQTRINAQPPSSSFVVQSQPAVKTVPARKPVAGSQITPVGGLKSRTYTPAALAGQAAFVQHEKRAVASQTRHTRPRLSLSTYNLDGNMANPVEEIYYELPTHTEANTSYSTRPAQCQRKMVGNGQGQSQSKHAEQVAHQAEIAKSRKAKTDAIARTAATKPQFSEPRPDFYSMPYEHQPDYQEMPRRRGSQASRGSATPLSAISDFFHKVVDKAVDKAVALVEKAESVEMKFQRPRFGSASGSVSSIFGSFIKDEETKREERKQKIKATISRPDPETFKSGADAFISAEGQYASQAKPPASKTRTFVVTKEGNNRDTSLGDFISYNRKQAPAIPAPRKPSFMSHITKASISNRRVSIDSDDSFHCQGGHMSPLEPWRQTNRQVQETVCRVCGKPSQEPAGVCGSCQPALISARKIPNSKPLPPPIPSSIPVNSPRASSFYPARRDTIFKYSPPHNGHANTFHRGLGNPYDSMFAGTHGNIFAENHDVSGEVTQKSECIVRYGKSSDPSTPIYQQQQRADEASQRHQSYRNTSFYEFYDEVFES